jgi:hypothetical protein
METWSGVCLNRPSRRVAGQVRLEVEKARRLAEKEQKKWAKAAKKAKK